MRPKTIGWKPSDSQSSIFAGQSSKRCQFNISALFLPCSFTRVVANNARLCHRCRIIRVAFTWKSLDADARVLPESLRGIATQLFFLGGSSAGKGVPRAPALKDPPRRPLSGVLLGVGSCCLPSVLCHCHLLTLHVLYLTCGQTSYDDHQTPHGHRERGNYSLILANETVLCTEFTILFETRILSKRVPRPSPQRHPRYSPCWAANTNSLPLGPESSAMSHEEEHEVGTAVRVEQDNKKSIG